MVSQMSYISYYNVKIIVYSYTKIVKFSGVLTDGYKVQAFRLHIVNIKTSSRRKKIIKNNIKPVCVKEMW